MIPEEAIAGSGIREFRSNGHGWAKRLGATGGCHG